MYTRSILDEEDRKAKQAEMNLKAAVDGRIPPIGGLPPGIPAAKTPTLVSLAVGVGPSSVARSPSANTLSGDAVRSYSANAPGEKSQC